MIRLVTIILIVLSLTDCSNSHKQLEPNLYAQREAPIGWVKFATYPDSTFEFSTGRGSSDKGTYKTNGDTLYLTSTDTAFKIDKVVILNKAVQFINSRNSNYHNEALIEINKLTKIE